MLFKVLIQLRHLRGYYLGFGTPFERLAHASIFES